MSIDGIIIIKYILEGKYKILIQNFFSGCEKVQHGEDGKYMWITGNDDSVFDKQSQSDQITSERMNTLLTNFVKYL